LDAHSTTLRHHVRTALVEDRILFTLGFDHRTICEDEARCSPGLVIRWSELWYGTATGLLLGTVTVDVVGVSPQVRDVVLDRVAVVLEAAGNPDGPARQIRRDKTLRNSFTVLAEAAISTGSTPSPCLRRNSAAGWSAPSGEVSTIRMSPWLSSSERCPLSPVSGPPCPWRRNPKAVQ